MAQVSVVSRLAERICSFAEAAWCPYLFRFQQLAKRNLRSAYGMLIVRGVSELHNIIAWQPDLDAVIMRVFSRMGVRCLTCCKCLAVTRASLRGANVLPLHARHPSQSSCTIIQFCFPCGNQSVVVPAVNKAVAVHASLHTCPISF